MLYQTKQSTELVLSFKKTFCKLSSGSLTSFLVVKYMVYSDLFSTFTTMSNSVLVTCSVTRSVTVTCSVLVTCSVIVTCSVPVTRSVIVTCSVLVTHSFSTCDLCRTSHSFSTCDLFSTCDSFSTYSGSLTSSLVMKSWASGEVSWNRLSGKSKLTWEMLRKVS